MAACVVVAPPSAHAGPPRGGSLAADVHRIEEARADYRSTVEGLLHRVHQARKQGVERAFEAVTRREDDAARLKRGAAIAQFEGFLKRFPSDPRWTPDALFRLAELYFEKAEEDYQIAWDAYNQRARATTGELGPAPTKDYARPIELFRRLATEFPKYRLLDGALYLLGYCIDETGDRRRARQVFLGLVCTDQHAPLDEPGKVPGKSTEDPYAECHSRWPGSGTLADAWMRLGEVDFDDGRFETASWAYRRVVALEPERLMELALYKVAWADYKLDRFATSVAAFDRVLVWGTEQLKKGKRTTNLQKEALQYLGLSLAEADWNGDGAEDADSGLKRALRIYKGREAEPHVREVFVAMGDVYFQAGKLDLAARVFEDVLRRWPGSPAAPTTHDRLVTCYERLRDFDKARVARDELVVRYGSGTTWAKANRGNPEAEQAARQISETNLERAAAAHHQRAQQLRKQLATPPAPAELQAAQKEYLAAATRYEELLAKFPRSENRYERTYDLAEAYYFGGKPELAAARYEEVRDWKGELRLREDAALGVLKSREDVVQAQIGRGALKEPPVPKAGAPVERRPMDPAYRALQLAEDQYVTRVGGPKSGPLAYAAAVISLRHGDLPEARRRLGGVVERFCKTHEGGLASDALVETYKLESDLAALGREATRLQGLSCGTPDSQKVRQGELAALMNDVRFRTAERLQRENKCEEAGPLYLKLVDQSPRDRNADRALNNAAVCFELVHRYGEATRTYERIVREYPASTLAEEALFRAAINHERFFEFEDAVAGYLALADDPRYEKSTHRTQALVLAAQILFNDRQYARAAALYQRFSRSTKTPGDAEAAAFKAAVALERAKKPAAAADALRAFLRDHAESTGDAAGTRLVAAAYKLGEALSAQKDEKGAEKAFKRAVKEWSDRKLPASGEAADFAARVVFARADRRFDEFVKLPLRSKTQKALETSVAEQLKLVRTLSGEFEKVLAYGRAAWSLAALHKQAELYFQLGQKLLKAPIPAGLAKKLGPEAEEIYREQLEQALRPLEQKAQEHWEKVVKRGADLGVANEWTLRARQRLNAFRPEEFPVLRVERVALELEGTP